MEASSVVLLLYIHICTGGTLSFMNPMDNDTTLYFGLMVSAGEAENDYNIAAVNKTLEIVNSDPNLLGYYNLSYVVMELQCERNSALRGFLEQVTHQHANRITAVIDASCTTTTDATAQLSHIFELSQLSCATSSPVFSDREKFQRYFQLLPTSSAVSHSHAGLMMEFGWRHVAFIVEQDDMYTLQVEASKSMLDLWNLTYVEYVLNPGEEFKGVENNPFDENRIFIIAASDNQILNVLCEAYKRDIQYPSHLFITYREHIANKLWLSSNDTMCSQEQIEEVLHRSLALSPEIKLSSGSYCHDATWALAVAINKSLTHTVTGQGEYQVDIREEIFHHLSETSFSFQGTTGRISFDENGIRNDGIFAVYQYRFGSGFNNSHLQIVKAGMFQSNNFSFIYESNETTHTIWIEHPWHSIPVHMHNSDGIPQDGSQDPVTITSLFLPVTIVFSVLASVGIILAVVCLVFNIAFRKRKVVKITSPTLNCFILGGVILFYIDVYFFVLPVYTPANMRLVCNFTTWLTITAYTFCFGTIITKIFRVWIIFRDPKPGSRKVVKDWALIAAVMALFALDMVFLTIYTAIEQTVDHSLTRIVTNIEIPEEQGKRFVTLICDSRAQDIVVGLYYGFKAILQLIAFILAFLTRKVKVKGLDNAKYIAAVIYITSLILSIIAICQFTISGIINAFAVVFSTGLLLGATCVLGLLFVPTMVRLYKDPNGEHVFVVPTTIGGQTICNSEEVDALKVRVRELEALLQSQSNNTVKRRDEGTTLIGKS